MLSKKTSSQATLVNERSYADTSGDVAATHSFMELRNGAMNNKLWLNPQIKRIGDRFSFGSHDHFFNVGHVWRQTRWRTMENGQRRGKTDGGRRTRDGGLRRLTKWNQEIALNLFPLINDSYTELGLQTTLVPFNDPLSQA